MGDMLGEIMIYLLGNMKVGMMMKVDIVDGSLADIVNGLLVLRDNGSLVV